MKILLIEDVDNLGYAGNIYDVANGYGRNYLIPQGMAIPATPGAIKQAETIRKAAEKRRAQEKADAEAIANQINDLELLFERRAGETGKLYGSVTSNDIAEAIEEKTGIEIDKRKVALGEPIRSLGEQEVEIKLMIDVSTTIKVEVLPMGGILERERLSEEEIEAIEEEQEERRAKSEEPVEAAEAAPEPPAEPEAEAEASEAEDAPEVEVEPEVEDTPEVEVEPEVEDAPEIEGEPEVEDAPEIEGEPEVEDAPEIEGEPEAEAEVEVEPEAEPKA